MIRSSKETSKRGKHSEAHGQQCGAGRGHRRRRHARRCRRRHPLRRRTLRPRSRRRPIWRPASRPASFPARAPAAWRTPSLHQRRRPSRVSRPALSRCTPRRHGGGPAAGADHPAFAPTPPSPRATTPPSNSRRATFSAAPTGRAFSARCRSYRRRRCGTARRSTASRSSIPAIRDLTEVLESRRVTPEDAEKAIKEYAAKMPEAERDKKLTELFASVLSEINTDRQFVMVEGRGVPEAPEGARRRARARGPEAGREGHRGHRRAAADRDEADARAAGVQLERPHLPGAPAEPDDGVRDPGAHRAAGLRDRPPDPRADEELTLARVRRSVIGVLEAWLAMSLGLTAQRAVTAASSPRRADSRAPASRRSRRETT